MKITNEDNMELMARYPDGYFDLAIVDPPYGINVANNTTGTVIRNKSDKDIFTVKNWDKAIPNKNYFAELFRVSKNQIIWGGNYFLDILGYCKAPIIWDKLNGNSMYADGELAWTSKNLPKNLKIFRHQWCGAFKASERGMKKYHPTQKPIALYEWLLINYAQRKCDHKHEEHYRHLCTDCRNQDVKILDTHLGSGSIAIACHNLGFDLTACELDKDYYDAAIKRIEQHKSQIRLF
jgi:site-specific DNA-methyltransferase (adenine-specific)